MTIHEIEFRKVGKKFGNLAAIRDLDLKVHPGTIHALVGENGAGKSTAMKILGGLYQPSEGELHVRGRAVSLRSPQQALKLGIGMVHQHFMLGETFNSAENIGIGHENRPLYASFPEEKIRTRLESVASEMGFNMNWSLPISQLSLGDRQKLEILKLLYLDCQILILDEPTAVLTPQEVDGFLERLRVLRGKGKTLVLVTHKLREVFAVADEVSVLRQGTCVAHRQIGETNPNELSTLMVGHPMENIPPRAPKPLGSTVLEVQHLTWPGHLFEFGFTLRQGQILGLAGVDGNGQHEIFQILSGLEIPSDVRGSILFEGEEILHRDPFQRRRQGFGFLPEDRLREGFIEDFSILENFNLGGGSTSQPELSPSELQAFLLEHDIRPPWPHLRAGSLSGGNQQKMVVARELRQTPKILVAFHPTRGVDLGAARRIHSQLRSLADQGASVLLVSTELDELFGLCDELLVLYRGRIHGRFTPENWSESTVGLAMTGVS